MVDQYGKPMQQVAYGMPSQGQPMQYQQPMQQPMQYQQPMQQPTQQTHPQI